MLLALSFALPASASPAQPAASVCGREARRALRSMPQPVGASLLRRRRLSLTGTFQSLPFGPSRRSIGIFESDQAPKLVSTTVICPLGKLSSLARQYPITAAIDRGTSTRLAPRTDERIACCPPIPSASGTTKPICWPGLAAASTSWAISLDALRLTSVTPSGFHETCWSVSLPHSFSPWQSISKSAHSGTRPDPFEASPSGGTWASGGQAKARPRRCSSASFPVGGFSPRCKGSRAVGMLA